MVSDGDETAVEVADALLRADHEVWWMSASAIAVPAGVAGVMALETLHRAGESPGLQDAYERSRNAHTALAGRGFDYVEFPAEGGLGYVAIREQLLLGTHGDTVFGVRGTPTSDRARAQGSEHTLDVVRRQIGILEDDAVRHADVVLGPSRARLEAIAERVGSRAELRVVPDPVRHAEGVVDLPSVADTASRTTPSTERVSVIIPFYREPLEMLSGAVRSALEQSYSHVDVVVVDDGSPREDADSILESVAAMDSRVSVVRKPNGGLASARNRGVEEAAGDYLLFLDADNELRSDYVALALAALLSNPEITAVPVECHHYRKRKGDGGIYRPLPFDKSLSLYRNMFGDACALFRASAFREHGLRYDPDVDLYSDWAIWLDCARTGLRVEPLPRVLFDYRVHASSMMATRAFDEHVPTLCLLIERHASFESSECQRMLTALTHGWGVGACLATLAPLAPIERDPAAFARAIYGGGLTARLLDRANRVSSRSATVRAVGRAAARGALFLHRKLGKLRKRSGPS